MLGFENIDEIMANLLKFKIQSGLYTRDFCSLTHDIIEKIKFFSMNNDSMYFNTKRKILIKDKFGKNAMETKILFFEESWSECGQIYSKTYVCPVVDKTNVER